MSSKSTVFFAATVAAVCMFATCHAQSGSRNAAPSFSPSQTYVQPPAPSNYAPAATPLQTMSVPTQHSVAPAPQPFASNCSNCQLGAATSQRAPVVNYAPQTSAPQYYAAPAQVHYAPQYTQSYSAPVYRAPQQYYAPAQNFRPVYRSYAPARTHSRSCGGH